MKYNPEEIINKTEYFKNSGLDIINFENIADNKIKITTENKNYVLGLYDIDSFDDIKKEEDLNKYLVDIGLEPLEVYHYGIMPDIYKSYKIFEYRNEKSLDEYLDEISLDERYDLGVNFGKILKKIHFIDLKDKKDDWYKLVTTKLNYLLYRHGLNDYKDDNDYILIDYLNQNLYICKNTSNNLLFSSLDYKNIRVYDGGKLDIRGLKKISTGDGTSDFIKVNKIALDYPEFARGVMKGYHQDKTISRKFYRLLAFYQAYAILKSLVDMREKKDAYLSEDEIEKIMQMYDDFSSTKPNWLD
jgi:hypothetical protein